MPTICLNQDLQDSPDFQDKIKTRSSWFGFNPGNPEILEILIQTKSTYFFTVVAYRRQHLFHHEMARYSLNQAITKTRPNYPFTIEAWVLLPDHLHCIWTLPDGDNDFSIRWNLIKSRFSKSVNIKFSSYGLDS